MLALLTAFTVAFASTPAPPAPPIPVRDSTICRDPATPLPILALNYDHWPAMPPGDRPVEARERLNTYFRTGRHRDYKEALLRYENLQRDFPSDPHVRLALLLLYASGSDLNFADTDGYRHVALKTFANADTRALRNAEWLLERDSTQWIAAIAVVRNALVTTEKGRTKQAYAALRRALSAEPDNVALNLAWYDLLIREERYADALQYLRMHGGDCAAQQTALAEALMVNGDTASGSRLYLRTLKHATSNELPRFYDDARVMMTVAQVHAYRKLAEAERAGWLLAFWKRAASASGRTVETRVAEQTVRVAYADANHRAMWVQGQHAKDRLAVISDTSHIVPWDAIGVYYVRHGPPDRRYRISGMPVLFEGWAYTAMDPPAIVLFSRTISPPVDWAPIEVPPCTPTGFSADSTERRQSSEYAPATT
jgi:hypothetical protein